MGMTFCLINNESNLNILIIFYFSPFLIINFLALIHIKRIFNLKLKLNKNIFKLNFFSQTLYFAIIGILSSIYIGLDYYFAAQLLTSTQINEYHIYSEYFYIIYFLLFIYSIFYKKIFQNYFIKIMMSN